MAAEPGNQAVGKPARVGGIVKWIAVGAVGLGLMSALAWAGASGVEGTAATAPASADAAAYMAQHARKTGVKTTESGLQYEVLTEGMGEKPTAADAVLVHYAGRLLDGTEFDSSYKRGQPAAFGVGDVIPGWTEGLQLMKTGSKYRFTIPPELGYGERGAGGVIPPNAVLVFDVELLEIGRAGA